MRTFNGRTEFSNWKTNTSTINFVHAIIVHPGTFYKRLLHCSFKDNIFMNMFYFLNVFNVKTLGKLKRN